MRRTTLGGAMNHQSSMAMSKLSARAARAIRECIALPGCRVQGAGCRVQGVGCRVWGSGWVRVQGGSAQPKAVQLVVDSVVVEPPD